MALTTITCIVAICDLCGRRNTDTEDGALADLTIAYGDAPAWTLTADGRLICDRTDQSHHEQRIHVHGWHPTDGATSLTFTPDTPSHRAHP
ncbi:hypothetical protein AB0E77_02460 [Streptomyces sp. NPDC032940]|uniref:hypothetical protein n=1 Tax=Streptomyces sp. NPDC032940 TaxID=3155366 RepID=UPI0033DBEF5B